jgi:hypothetical protein
MSVIFSPCSGAVEVKRADCAETDVLSISVGGSKLDAIVTGLTLELSGNYQFLHTLQDLVYFHAFGDRVGTLNITGLGFAKSCPGLKKGSILNLYKYYNDNKVTKSGNTPKVVIISSDGEDPIKLWGFLTGMRIDVSDSQLGTVGYWSLRFEVLPQKS